MHIVITDFDGFEQTRICLQSLQSSIDKGHSVILVDHGTSLVTAKSVATEFPNVERISGSPDVWWAGATNLGVRHALAQGADRIMLLNNDCYLEGGAFETLVSQSDRHPTAIVAPLQRHFHTGLVSTSAIRTCFLLGFPTIILSRSVPKQGNLKGLARVDLIRGGRGVVIPASVFDTVGLFDEHEFPHYYADHDFYLRAGKQGVPLYLAVNAVVEVDDARTSVASEVGAMSVESFVASFKIRRSHRNVEAIRAIFKKHYPVPQLYVIGMFLYYARYILVYIFARSARMLGFRKVW